MINWTVELHWMSQKFILIMFITFTLTYTVTVPVNLCKKGRMRWQMRLCHHLIIILNNIINV